MPCQLLLSWHPEGRNLVIKRMGKKQQLHDFCLQLWSRVLFPSLPLEVSFHTFSALFLIKAPPPTLSPCSSPSNQQSQLPSLSLADHCSTSPKGHLRVSVLGTSTSLW